MVLGIPGLAMLARFVPIGVREPQFVVEDMSRTTNAPAATSTLVSGGVVGGLLVGVGSLALVALLDALKTMRETPAAGFDFGAALSRVFHPGGVTDWIQLVGILAFAAISGLFVAAAMASRHRSAGVASAEEPPARLRA
jgi:PAT family beta-lactamase induction signal transducer AmpG